MRWINHEEVIERLKGLNCILALESAADFIGLSNAPYRDRITVYSTDGIENEVINGVGIECIRVDNYSEIEHEEFEGIFVTRKEQTLIGILRYNRDLETIYSSLANYYFENNETFGSLTGYITEDIRGTFEYYKEGAIEYYDED